MSRHTLRRALPVATAVALAATTLGSSLPHATAETSPTDVLYVSNNWEGTIDVLRGSGDLQKIGRINAIPDKKERLNEIYWNPIAWIAYTYIKNTAGEGHDQYVDDAYSTQDGTAVVVSRPSFADVVSIDTRTNEINWRFKVDGFRSDHMAISPDGKRVAVSASSGNVVHVLDMATGTQLGKFKTGDKPHENVWSPDGKQLWNMAIGNVETSQDAQWQDFTKGNRRITVVDGNTYAPIRTVDMRSRLDAVGRKDLSNSVRPITFTPDFTKAYFQVSFFGGVVEYDIASDKITRIKEMPKNPALNPDRTTWVNDSRHHGIVMNHQGNKLCVAGTMDDYATIVDRATLEPSPTVPMDKPYWATLSTDGKQCVVSESGSDRVSAIDFATGRKTTTVAVGDHPQRVRAGVAPDGWVPPIR